VSSLLPGLVAISTPLVAAILAFVVLDIFAIVFGLSFVRANRAARETADGQIEVAGKPVKSLSRRDFFRRSLLTSLMVFGAQFGGATIAFLWPNLRGGFGSLVNAGNVNDLKAEINSSAGVAYNGTGRFYVVGYNGSPNGDVDYVAEGGACTSGAGCPSATPRGGSSARATGRSTTAPVSTSSAPPPAAWIGSRSRSPTATSSSTRAR
jgi:hypothetical protein